jgi:hypothetical protein
LHQRRRQLRLRILGTLGARECDQAGDLVLLVFRPVDAAAAAGGAGPQAAAVHLNGDHRGGARHARRQLPPAPLLGLLVA